MHTFDRLDDEFQQGKHDPADFAVRLLHKDVGLAANPGRIAAVLEADKQSKRRLTRVLL